MKTPKVPQFQIINKTNRTLVTRALGSNLRELINYDFSQLNRIIQGLSDNTELELAEGGVFSGTKAEQGAISNFTLFDNDVIALDGSIDNNKPKVKLYFKYRYYPNILEILSLILSADTTKQHYKDIRTLIGLKPATDVSTIGFFELLYPSSISIEDFKDIAARKMAFSDKIVYLFYADELSNAKFWGNIHIAKNSIPLRPNPLRPEIESFYKIDYSKVDQIITEYLRYKFPGKFSGTYECVPAEEWNNYSSHEFHIEPNELNESQFLAKLAQKKGILGNVTGLTQDILCAMCHDNLIPGGKYLIKVYW